MKKSILICSGLFWAFCSFAGEWGGTFSNLTEFAGKESDLKLIQKDGVSLWGKLPISKDNESYLYGDISYNFKYDGQDDSLRSINNILNVNNLSANFNWKIGEVSKIQLKAGRFSVVDGTSSIFTQNSDGILAGFKNDKINFSVFASYTGFLNSKSTEMVDLSLFGLNSDYTESDNDFYTFAAKYIPVSVSVKVPFRAQNFIFQGWGVFDANGSNINRFYATLGLNGFLTRHFSYNLVSSFGSRNFENISNLSKLSFSTLWGNFIFSLNSVYASGENGKFSSFIGVTKQSAIYAKTNTEYSGVILAGFNASYLFGKIVSVVGSFDTVFNAQNEVEYRGVQAKAGVFWNIFSDLRLGSSVRYFIAKESEQNKLTVDLALNFVF